MADEPPESTRRISLVLSRNFESRRVDGVVLDRTGLNKVSLAFYVERTPLVGWTEYKMTPEGRFGDAITNEDAESGVILEYQQEILLDEEDARYLRDRLNETLGDDEP